jgi:MFS family permease
MGHTLGMFGLAPVTGWLVDRLGQLPMVLIGGLILMIASIMTPLGTDVTFLIVTLFLLGLGWNFTFIAGSSMMAEAVAMHERGRAQGFSESLVALASGSSSLGTGLAFAYGGIVLVGAIGLACSLAFMAAALWTVQTQRAITTEVASKSN